MRSKAVRRRQRKRVAQHWHMVSLRHCSLADRDTWAVGSLSVTGRLECGCSLESTA